MLAVIAASGVVLAAIYLLYMVGKVIFGPVLVPDVHTDDGGHELKDLDTREIFTLLPLAAACLILGMLPHGMLASLEAPVGQLTASAKAAAELDTVFVEVDTQGTPLRLAVDDHAAVSLHAPLTKTAPRAAER